MNCNNPQMNSCTKNVAVMNINDLPIDNLESIPDYYLTIRTFPNQETGEVISTFTRVPGIKVTPTGNLDNVFSLQGAEQMITIPENQVVPAYVQNNGSTNQVLKAGTNNAQFLLIGTYGNMYLCQNTGVINMINGHNYIISQQYYAATNGTVSTSGTQKLFIPVSQTKLLINM